MGAASGRTADPPVPPPDQELVTCKLTTCHLDVTYTSLTCKLPVSLKILSFTHGLHVTYLCFNV